MATPIEQCPEVYQELFEHVRKLKMLLDDPEPGLWSWCNMVASTMKSISELYGGPK